MKNTDTLLDQFNVYRCPRAFDRALGVDILRDLPESDVSAEFLTGVAGSSPYLADLLVKERDWWPQALTRPQAHFEQLLAALMELSPDQMRFGLRQGKRRMALLTALCDIAGCWPLEQVTQAITRFAQTAVDVALKSEIRALILRGKLPGQAEADTAHAGGLSILAMGKMGASELNYSSDIDLICLLNEDRYAPDDFVMARSALVRATRNLCAVLSDRTGDGYVFRTDLRLRPDPAVTPVAVSMDAAMRYYESLGRSWERAAYIKARGCAGDIEGAERFLASLTPFVWRRHLDFAAIEDAHDIRLRIRESKLMGRAITFPGHNMKLGRGGIREIEFFTQTRQLIAGGRDKTLRSRGTVSGLNALAQAGWIKDEVAVTLSDHYRAHREVEHRIQMIHDAQTHQIPQNQEGQARVASLMGMDVEDMQRDTLRRLEEVHELTEGFFTPSDVGGSKTEIADSSTFQIDQDVVARWRSYPALRSERGARIFDRLKPDILARLGATANPAEALIALDGFLKGLPAGVQLFSLFEANPQLVDLLVDIVGTAPDLAEHLSRNASVFDAVINGGFFAQWPGQAVLQSELSGHLKGEQDYEARLDYARRWCKEWHFRIGVHLLRGLIDADVAGQQYGDLAQSVIAALSPHVKNEFARKHGPAPGRGYVVVAMGSLGAGRLNAQSDLDLIVVYDPEQAETSDGKRPLAVRTYYARLTQALVTALSAPMSQGRLYEVDMRLRPSGSQGPVAASWASFVQYQKQDAWVWEHLALTRARVVAGDAGLAHDFEQFRTEFLALSRDPNTVLEEVARMRARLKDAKRANGTWDAKTGPGRMLDIELIAQAGNLISRRSSRSIFDGLLAVSESGWMPAQDADDLARAYRLMWSIQSAGCLIAGKTLETIDRCEGACRFMLRAAVAAGFESSDLETLQSCLEDTYRQCADTIGRITAIVQSED